MRFIFLELAFACYLAVPGCEIFFFLKTFFKAAEIFRVYALPKQRRYRVQLRV